MHLWVRSVLSDYALLRLLSPPAFYGVADGTELRKGHADDAHDVAGTGSDILGNLGCDDLDQCI